MAKRPMGRIRRVSVKSRKSLGRRNGVHVDGVSAGKPAEKAGIKTGDVIFQLGENKVSDVQTYMEALNKFNKGDQTKVRLMRGKEELVLEIIF